MPRLLKDGRVQLHMPRTGGHSLAKQVGILDLIGTIHDGPGQIPAAWKHRPTVTTFRGPQSWYLSMCDYLDKTGGQKMVYHFLCGRPNHLELDETINPTFGLWADPGEHFREFITGNNFRSWYEAYIAYFVKPADQVIPIEKLTLHENKL